MTSGKRVFLVPGTLGKNHGHRMKKSALSRHLVIKKNDGRVAPSCRPEAVTPADHGSGEIPTEEVQAEIPTEEVQAEIPTEEVQAEIPTEVQDEIPIEEVQAEIPTEEMQAEIPTEEVQAEIETSGSSLAKSKKRSRTFKPRGPNMCKRLGSLKEGEKLKLTFYHNGAVGDHHHLVTSYMGLLVRDRLVVPIRVHRWNDIDEAVKDHLWASVSSKFKSDDFSLNRYDTLRHMRKIWQGWRGYLVQKYIKPAGTKEKALANGPKEMPQADWEWLVNEHFFDPEILKVRIRNSENRASLTMPHRTGSTPFRHIAYDQMGGKEGNNPSISDIFKKTRATKTGELDAESASKLADIIDIEDQNPGFSTFEVVEGSFGPQDRGHVVGFGYGLKPKYVRGPLKSRSKLNSIIRNKDQEIGSLRTRVENLEGQFHDFLHALKKQPRSVDNDDAADAGGGLD